MLEIVKFALSTVRFGRLSVTNLAAIFAFIFALGPLTSPSNAADGRSKQDICDFVAAGSIIRSREVSDGYTKSGIELEQYLVSLAQTMLNRYNERREQIYRTSRRLEDTFEWSPLRRFPGNACSSTLIIAYLPIEKAIEFVPVAPKAGEPISRPFFSEHPSSNPDDAFFASYTTRLRFAEENDFQLLEACVARRSLNYVSDTPGKNEICLRPKEVK